MISNNKYFILIFLIFFQCYLYKKNKELNRGNHATDLSYYAHFSQINKYNYFIYPKLIDKLGLSLYP